MGTGRAAFIRARALELANRPVIVTQSGLLKSALQFRGSPYSGVEAPARLFAQVASNDGLAPALTFCLKQPTVNGLPWVPLAPEGEKVWAEFLCPEKEHEHCCFWVSLISIPHQPCALKFNLRWFLPDSMFRCHRIAVLPRCQCVIRCAFVHCTGTWLVNEHGAGGRSTNPCANGAPGRA